MNDEKPTPSNPQQSTGTASPASPPAMRPSPQASSPSSNISFKVAVEYARLQGYLEGYLDQLSSSKNDQERLIEKVLGETAELLNPILGSGRS